jgi:heme-degrading monooxygenase HmoA
MPHKHNAACRHHIGKMKFMVTNWAGYEAGLRRRGSLTLWITLEALAGWAAHDAKRAAVSLSIRIGRSKLR